MEKQGIFRLRDLSNTVSDNDNANDSDSEREGEGESESKSDGPPFFYELSIYISPTVDSYASLRAKYLTAATKQNTLFDDASIDESDKFYDAGFDLFVPTASTVEVGTTVALNHGITCAMLLYNTTNSTILNVPYYLYMRSSTAFKTPLRLANAVGIIDAGYRGSIIAVFDHLGLNNCNDPYNIEPFQRLVQVCCPNMTYPFCVRLVDTIADLGGPTLRGAGGFGSTGK